MPAIAPFCYYPCPCGWYGDAEHECTCSMTMVSRYQKRVSGPLMDRIDIHVEVPAVKYEKLTDDRLGEPSAVVRARVEAAREIQRRRFEGTTLACNADRHSLPLGWARPRFASSAGWTKGERT